jgi:hypothetical protein
MPVSIALDSARALDVAQGLDTVVVVAGSLYLAGEIRNLL